MELIKIRVKHAFTKTKIPGAKWVLNPYVGCEHACKYCYAKFMCRVYPFGKWGEWIVVKENIQELIMKEVVSGRVYIGSVTDVYQPVEKRLEITRRVLKVMNKKIPVSILTKSPLVLRDIEIFKEFSNIEVGLTINTFEGKIKKEIEPFSPSIESRIEALKELYENSIRNYAFISPIIPGITDIKRLVEETKNFVEYYIFEFLNLKAGGSEFRTYLKQNFPKSVEILLNKNELEKQVKIVERTVKESGIKIKGIYVHYPQKMREVNTLDKFLENNSIKTKFRDKKN